MSFRKIPAETVPFEPGTLELGALGLRVSQKVSKVTDQFAWDYNVSPAGLSFHYKGGIVVSPVTGAVSVVLDGSVAVTNGVPNYVELDRVSGTVTSNTVSFTEGRVPVAVVTPAGDNVTETSVQDYRPTIGGAGVDSYGGSATGGGGGGGAGHTPPQYVATGDGLTSVFALTRDGTNGILVIGGVIQRPSVDYVVGGPSNATLTLTAPLENGVEMYFLYADLTATAGPSATRVHLSADQALPGVVAFDVVSYDDAGEWRTAGSRLVSEAGGIYLLAASVSVLGTAAFGTDTYVEVWVNGLPHSRLGRVLEDSAHRSPVVGGSAVLRLSPGDYAQVYAHTNATGSPRAEGGSATTFLSAVRLW